MPIIAIENREGISPKLKAEIAKEMTAAVHEIILSPNDLISVIFHDLPAYNTYRSGEPTTETLIFCHIRLGRTDQAVLNLAKAMSRIWSQKTKVPESEIEVAVASYPAKHVVRGGARLEEPPIV
ncbi:tautomerase family protein [Rhodoferax sp. UBA5149]|uniref:tautomerase family protein n=1 Tax=Rhodoferax sp. UBA5149 TaxID=1947379 RepID=UPI0025F912C6|nr:tautomerase family protein [Rhodoferax sp. UBA5149]